MEKLIHLRLSKIFLLLPVQNDRKFWNVVHTLFVVISLLLVCAVNLYARQKTYYHHIKNLKIMLDILIHTFTTLTNVTSVVIAGLLRRKIWPILVRNKLWQSKNTNIRFYILTVLYTIHVCSEISFYAKINPYIIIFIVPDFVNGFIILISILNINYFANGLTNVLENFKVGFEKEKMALAAVKKSETNPFIASQIFGSKSRTDYLFKCFIQICIKLGAFNKIYGWQILHFAANLLIFLYDSLNELFNEVARNRSGKSHRNIIYIKLIKCLIFWIYGILLIRPCFKFNYEMDKVVVICRKMLIELPQTLNYGFSYYLKLKLIFLIKHIEMKKPYFSAAGFFEVDYVMLVYIFNGLISYLLVTQQAT